MDIPKNDTDPKSDKVSIATRDRPATIAGLAEGKIILKKDFFLLKPRFFPSSIKFCHGEGLSYVSASPHRIPIAIVAAAQAAIEQPKKAKRKRK